MSAKKDNWCEQLTPEDLSKVAALEQKVIHFRDARFASGCQPEVRAQDIADEAKLEVPYEPAFFDPDDLTRAPGIVGRIIDYEPLSALYPNRPLYVGSALVTVGTLMGKRVIGQTEAGHPLYILLVSKTAGGKQHPMDCTRSLLTKAGYEQWTGAVADHAQRRRRLRGRPCNHQARIVGAGIWQAVEDARHALSRASTPLRARVLSSCGHNAKRSRLCILSLAVCLTATCG